MTAPAARRVTTLIYQGGDWFASFMCMEFTDETQAAWWPFGDFGVMGVIGRLRFGMSEPLILTAIAGTPAATSPATLTASKALLASNYPTKLLYGPTLRKLPIRQELMPYTSGDDIVWCSTT